MCQPDVVDWEYPSHWQRLCELPAAKEKPQMPIEWEYNDNWDPEADPQGEGYGPDDAWVCKTNPRYIVILSLEEKWHLMDNETGELLHASKRADDCKAFAEILMETNAPSPEELCRFAEIQLVDFVLDVIKRPEGDWWGDRIPTTIRQECAKRQEEEGCRYPKHAYFDLIDLKTIMGKNWPLFEPHFKAVGLEGGKERSLAWIDGLNQIRRLVGHPLKRHVAGHLFSMDEIQSLADSYRLTFALWRREKGLDDSA
jgi:hypothetical protein